MKKILCALLALGMAFSLAACGGNGDHSDDGNNSSSVSSETSVSTESSAEESIEDSSTEEESSAEESIEDSFEEEFIPDYASPAELTEYFSGRVGEVTYNTGKDVTIRSLLIDAPIYMGAYSEQNVFTVDGGADFNRTLTVIGDGGGIAQANGGTLIFKNLTIKNETRAFEDNYYRPNYAEFGGKVRFENCTFDCSIQLRSDAEAEFIGCEIRSIAIDQYSVWIADGSAKFDGCTFTGYRGLKVHEIAGMDVVNVSVENCVFDNLSKKPAIAIDIAQEISTTTISFKNCEIDNCAEWAKDSLEGVDGFYESDQDTTTFNFTAANCTLDGELFDFGNGQMILPL